MALVAISYEDAETAWKGLFFKFPNKISSCPVIGSYTRRAKETYTPGCQLATVKNKKKIKIKLTNEVSTRKKFAQVNKTDPNWASHLIKKKKVPARSGYCAATRDGQRDGERNAGWDSDADAGCYKSLACRMDRTNLYLCICKHLLLLLLLLIASKMNSVAEK